MLFFYGGGESVARYDDIAPHYNEIGANFFVADYRGSAPPVVRRVSTPYCRTRTTCWTGLQETMRTLRFTGPLYVMGRSMGCHSAGELAINARDRINGVIIESGRPNLGRIAEGLEPVVVQALEDDYQAKFYSIDIPALVIHGQWDQSAPLADAVGMFNKLETAHKHLEIVPGAGHNDLMYVGFRQYFNAIKGFMAAGTPGRAQRLRPQAKPPSRGGSETSRGTRFQLTSVINLAFPTPAGPQRS